MKKFDSINVIPFVDIMLVLLAIVLTSATFVTNGQLDIALPDARTTSEMSLSDPVEIAVATQGLLYLNGELIDESGLLLAIQTLSVDSAVRLKVDEAVAFQRFVTVVDALKARGIGQIAVETQVLP